MHPVSSLLGFFKTIGRDIRLTREGAVPGWWTRKFYKSRFEQWYGQPASRIDVALTVKNKRVRVLATTGHLNVLLGIFVDRQYDLRAKLAIAPTRILDIGANVGTATAYLNALYPGATFVCVEPDSRNLPFLEQTLAANNIRARVIPAAVGAEVGRLKLRSGRDPTCSSLENVSLHGYDAQAQVDVLTVADILAQVGWDAVDLVKMDIEGAEAELLGRNNQWLSKVKAIVLEIHPNTNHEEIGNFLRPFGFTLSRMNTRMEPVYFACHSEPAS